MNFATVLPSKLDTRLPFIQFDTSILELLKARDAKSVFGHCDFYEFKNEIDEKVSICIKIWDSY